jgi:hypothetical protein
MPGVVQRLGRGIALLFHDLCTRRGRVFSVTPRAHFTPGKDPVPIVQKAGWVPGPVWTDAQNLAHTGIRYWTVQPVAQSLYRLSYPAHKWRTRFFFKKEQLISRDESLSSCHVSLFFAESNWKENPSSCITVLGMMLGRDCCSSSLFCAPLHLL